MEILLEYPPESGSTDSNRKLRDTRNGRYPMERAYIRSRVERMYILGASFARGEVVRE